MLWALALIFLLWWLIGLVSTYTFGGFIYVFLIAAVVIALVARARGRSPTP